jgi:hypothetical protein
MDIQGIAQLLGNFGEFFGAIAVVATLAYLAVQIRQNTNALRSASYEHWNEVSNSFYDFATLHADEISEIEQHESIDALSRSQLLLLMGLASRAILQGETAFLQYQAGTLDEEVFEARMRSLETFFSTFPIARGIWEIRRQNHPTKFVGFLEGRFSELRPQAA